MDFGIFQEQKVNKVYVLKEAQTKSVQFKEAPIVAPSVPIATTSSSTSNRMHHANVICDGCEKEIYGYRYKCLECHDFDLCMECEPKMHNHHLMIRIADPGDADICYRSKLGKRFLRHRRSESLCAKDEKIAKHHHNPHHHGHKRHSSSASARRPNTLSDYFLDVLQSINNPNQNANATTSAETPSQSSNDGNQNKTGSGTSTTKTTPTAPPQSTAAPSYGFNFGNANGTKAKSPCVPLKQSIDMLSHMAQNFATMMDPFGAYMETLANASTSAAAASSASAAATAAASAATASAKAAEKTATPTENVSVSVSAVPIAEPMDHDAPGANKESNKEPNKESNKEPNPTQEGSDVMIIDCSDDEDEDIRKMITSLNVNSNESNTNKEAAAADANKKDDSNENGKF